MNLFLLNIHHSVLFFLFKLIPEALSTWIRKTCVLLSFIHLEICIRWDMHTFFLKEVWVSSRSSYRSKFLSSCQKISPITSEICFLTLIRFNGFLASISVERLISLASFNLPNVYSSPFRSIMSLLDIKNTRVHGILTFMNERVLEWRLKYSVLYRACVAVLYASFLHFTYLCLVLFQLYQYQKMFTSSSFSFPVISDVLQDFFSSPILTLLFINNFH